MNKKQLKLNRSALYDFITPITSAELTTVKMSISLTKKKIYSTKIDDEHGCKCRRMKEIAHRYHIVVYDFKYKSTRIETHTLQNGGLHEPTLKIPHKRIGCVFATRYVGGGREP